MLISQNIPSLLLSDQWPQAIDPICLEQCRQQRAEMMLFLLIGPEALSDTCNFLDFGCQDNTTINAAIQAGAENATGYDIQISPGVITDFAQIQNQGPYDTILVHDVLDHLIDETMEEVMCKITSIMSPHGRIYMRCHPYTSRTGTHTSHVFNKAYSHLFTKEILGIHTPEILDPLSAYRKAIYANPLKEEYELPCKQQIEDFFTSQPYVHSHLKKLFHTNDIPKEILEIQFVEYILYKIKD